MKVERLTKSQTTMLPFDTCIYKKMFLDYLWGVGKIYFPEEIEKAKISASFPQEYQLQYQGLFGNVFSTQSIESCQKIRYNQSQINQNAKKTIGVDAGFGSSKFAIVVTQFVDGKIQVIFAEEYDRPNFQAMINRIGRSNRSVIMYPTFTRMQLTRRSGNL